MEGVHFRHRGRFRRDVRNGLQEEQLRETLLPSASSMQASLPCDPFLELLQACRKVRGVKKTFVGSGIRFDLFLHHPELLEEIMVHHAGRFLRIAPEHTEDTLLRLMRKPSFDTLVRFIRFFESINRRLRRKIQLAPYLIVGHPGESRADVESMAEKVKSLGLLPKDVQIFTPTPGTLSTAMFHSGVSPAFKPVEVEKKIIALIQRKNVIVI